MAKNDLTEYAIKGYKGQYENMLPTSPVWYAYHLGKHMNITGRTMPHDVRMSRGCTIRANGLLFKHTGANKELNMQVFERIE